MASKRLNPVFYAVGADFLFSITLIFVLMSIAMNEYSEARKMVVVSAGVEEAASNLKTDMSVYYALHGEWPAGYEELAEQFPNRKDGYNDLSSLKRGYSKYSHNITHGAIDVKIARLEGNNVVTLHPAVPIEDPLGPVKWVAGSGGHLAGWNIAGEDHTTVDEKYLNRTLK